MKPGCKHFLKHLNQLELKILLSEKYESPALWLYQNDLRTPLFMLEGLARIYRDFLSSKKCEKLYQKFKTLEDALGSIDYYDSLYEYSQKNDLDQKLTNYFKKKYKKALLQFENILINENWYKSPNKINYSQFSKLRDQIRSLNWVSAKLERKAIGLFLNRNLDAIDKQYQTGRFDFDHLEEGLHEFRRRIRWISIYAHALNGQLVLESTSEVPDAFKEYCTDVIKNSPFNILEENYRLKPLKIKDYLFFALSFVIDRMGKLKDNGQLVHAIAQAAVACGLCDENNNDQFVRSLIGEDYLDHDSIAEQARTICDELIIQKKLLKNLKIFS